MGPINHTVKFKAQLEVSGSATYRVIYLVSTMSALDQLDFSNSDREVHNVDIIDYLKVDHY